MQELRVLVAVPLSITFQVNLMKWIDARKNGGWWWQARRTRGVTGMQHAWLGMQPQFKFQCLATEQGGRARDGDYQ